ncbi:hypothetical protein CHS0354_024962 [Potamilus streckersoni]|uniref:Uncharacterized protein n=1 Tax=Potamilus streckersoni TaxID=2493646 RepID=A0AAE0T197_9BIVA|nr:hypothetical protein CHS0354_024962 [Potamilus streckersoni]
MYAVSKSTICSPADSLFETKDILITEKFETLGATMGHLLRAMSVESRGSQEIKGVKHGKTERKTALALSRTKASVKADTYDGSQHFPDYITHFEHCEMINDWSETEKGLRLVACLRKYALQVLTDLQAQPS